MPWQFFQTDYEGEESPLYLLCEKRENCDILAYYIATWLTSIYPVYEYI